MRGRALFAHVAIVLARLWAIERVGDVSGLSVYAHDAFRTHQHTLLSRSSWSSHYERVDASSWYHSAAPPKVLLSSGTPVHFGRFAMRHTSTPRTGGDLWAQGRSRLVS